MNHRDLSNLAALFGVQAANAALPLLVFPHLLNVAGQELYAQVALAEAIALAALTAALYSFDLDAVSGVVGLDPHRDADAISHAFSGVLFARLILLVGAAAVAMLGCMMLAPALVQPLAWWLLLPLSHVLQSAWMFQGLEHNTPIALSTLASRLTGIGLILWLVRTPADYILVPAIVGSLALLGALALLSYLRFMLGVQVCRVPWSEIVALLYKGRVVFFGNASVFMYRDMNVVLLGAAGTGASAVAAYSIAEKLVKGIQASVRPLNQLFFPKAVRAIKGMPGADRPALRSLLTLTRPQLGGMVVMMALLAAGWVLAADRLPLLRDLPERHAIGLLVLAMVPAVFVGVLNFMLGSVGLNHLSQSHYLFGCLLAVGATNIVVCFALAHSFGRAGAAAAFVLSEMLLAVLIVRRYLAGHGPAAARDG